MLDENERWLLSFYRASEIGGALFFGRLARSLRPGQIQVDMTKHFADEAQHAWLWTQCMDKLGVRPVTLLENYQDQYSSAVGLPANLMEVLAITQVFEKRVVNQYARHSAVKSLNSTIHDTVLNILKDEKWHLEWIKGALEGMEKDYGKEEIETTLKRFTAADDEVYKATMKEHEDRLTHAMHSPRKEFV